MSVIVKFDDMYAAALTEHAIKKATGKKLKVTYKRYMSESNYKDHIEQIDDTIDESNPHAMSKSTPRGIVPNPRKNYFPMRVMHMILKTVRIYYVSFGFYFMPISAMLLNFL